jgi:thioester reductase-like protein
MRYLVTGATGFVGVNLVRELARRDDAEINVVVRPRSLHKVEDLVRRTAAPAGRIVPVVGDLRERELGVSPSDLRRLQGVDQFVHLAAIYDLDADHASTTAANVGGVRHALALAERLGAGCFHHCSSIVVAGAFDGVFTEAMLDEGGERPHPYFASKAAGERLVRASTKIPWRIYRPGIVVGRSDTGEADRVDGAYYFFGLIRSASRLPASVTVRMPFDPRLNLVPVDFVARAIDHLVHAPGLDGQTFHLTDPNPAPLTDVFTTLSALADGPRYERLGGAPASIVGALTSAGGPVGWLTGMGLRQLGIPSSATVFSDWSTTFDCTNTTTALAGTGIECPSFGDYADRIWSYWDRCLEPTGAQAALHRAVEGRVICVTGASSGVGHRLALRLAAGEVSRAPIPPTSRTSRSAGGSWPTSSTPTAASTCW